MQNPEAKSSKLREAKAVGSIAKRFLTGVFYHLYYFDFRGRKYPATAYFHEQGTDASKGMLLRADSKPIGKSGFEWLLISIASNWAGSAGREDGAKTDKIPLADRINWALDNKEILLSYAENPKVNQGWMKADKPWQFLAACNEWLKAKQWVLQGGIALDDKGEEVSIRSIYDYQSSLECYIDGSNNGSQHLSALTKDEITAPHVNLIPLDLPGDLYKYVGDHVWKNIDAVVGNYDKSKTKESEVLIDTLTEMKKQIQTAEPRSEIRKELIEKLMEFKTKHKEQIKAAAPVFWWRIVDAKQRRKVVKRNVMTLPYGGTPYGLGQQQIDDARKHGISSLMTMEHAWGSYMGREVYEDCKKSLARPMRLLGVFEEAGRKAEERGEFLKWNVPVTGFPVVQHYVEGTTKRTWIQYGPPVGERLSTGYYANTLQLHICFIEETKISKGRQSAAASPNCIHSLDAAHLTLCVNRCEFPVTTIHDSFGCLLGDMADLFRVVRETFVELYKSNPLESLMKDIDGDITQVEIGNLDIDLVLESEYCFA
jgi:DNA-directed RNA polymerase